jgi:protein arginine N-methyltransferase 1
VLDFHRGLISDEVRTLAFREAIRATVKPGDVVVDLGSGSGILAFFAAQAGAARVYAIEKQHTADAAAMLARHNGLEDRIVVIHEHSLQAELPERANVLITETLGTLGLEEQILSLTLDARERFVVPDAVILPRGLTIALAPVELGPAFERHVSWWSEPRYGVDLAPMRTFASNVIYATDVEPRSRLDSPATLIDVDLRTNTNADARGEATFQARRDGVFHGFAGWFTATLVEGIRISNELPGTTRWQQAFLPLEHPVSVRPGEEITVRLETHDGRAWRWRGHAGGRAFDQTTWLSAPPCTLLAT